MRAPGDSCKAHIGFFWGSTAFFVVAVNTGAHQVFPLVGAAARAGDNVVDGKRWACGAAVLAAVVVAAQDVFTRQLDLLVGDAQVGA